MTERDQLRRVCRWNDQLAHSNRRLEREAHRLRLAVRDLETENARIRVEATACDALLGAAMDAAVKGGVS